MKYLLAKSTDIQISCIRQLQCLAIIFVSAMMLFSLSTVDGDEDPFAFMPVGGKQLLTELLEKCKTCDEMETIATTDRTEKAWREYLVSRETALQNLPREELDRGALANLTAQEERTLVAYLTVNFPLKRWRKKYPQEGREMALEICIACHGAIWAPSTRPVSGWLSTFKQPMHSGIPFRKTQAQELAHYFAINLPIPVEEIPEELMQEPNY